MTAAKIAALVAVAILCLTASTKVGIGMWNHAHPHHAPAGRTGYEVQEAFDELSR